MIKEPSANPIEEAKKELESPIVAYTEFVLDFKKEDSFVYCFYEGLEDRNYYSFRIKNISLKENYFDYVCFGKDNLKKVYDLIQNQQQYRQSRVAWFKDRDFDPLLNVDRIYETPFYSIENFYTTKDAFENILLNEFNISRNSADFSKSLVLFLNAQKKFHSETLYFNAWLACQSEIKLKSDSSFKLNIDNHVGKYFDSIVGNDLVTIKDFSILKNKASIEKIFKKAPIITEDQIERKILNLKESIFQNTFRGKFEIQFLNSFIQQFQREIGKPNSNIFSKKFNCSLRFEINTMISQLTNNAHTPICLIQFILKFLK